MRASMGTVLASPAPHGAGLRNGLCASEFAPPLLDGGIAFADGIRVATDLLALQRLMMARGSNEIFVRMGSGGGEAGEGFVNARRRAGAGGRRAAQS